jgi:hypothetical protein
VIPVRCTARCVPPAVFGAVRLDRRGRFHTTRLLRQLRSADPGRAADWCRYIGSAAQQAAWTALSHSILTGDSAFRSIHGCSSFEWFAAHPAEGRQFNSGIAGLTTAEAPLIAGAYPFPDAVVVCDIGGGPERSSPRCCAVTRDPGASWSRRRTC